MAKPEGVRVVREDGSVLPVELVHVGDEDGQDIWGIAGVRFHIGRDRVEVDVFPAHTGLRFIGSLPDDEEET